MVFLHGKTEILAIINEVRKCWVANFPNIPADKCFQIQLPEGLS